MKHWLLIALVIAIIAVAVWATSTGKVDRVIEAIAPQAGRTPVAAKPICTSPVNPNVAAPLDCIPQHLAKLPPDPGEAGKLTIDGIDSDKDGVRDDVQRYIVETWSHSERAMQALFLQAKTTQMRVHYGDLLGKEETRKLMPEIMRTAICSNRIEITSHASQVVRDKVTNTPERWKRSREFDYLLAHNVYDLPDPTVAEACGFDPEKLPN